MYSSGSSSCNLMLKPFTDSALHKTDCLEELEKIPEGWTQDPQDGRNAENKEML